MVTVERWTLPAAFEAPRVARRLARTYAAAQGAPDETLAAIALCVSEAVTNVVVHAYREAKPGARLCGGSPSSLERSHRTLIERG
jgi:anti-sigma regulatory factor (Ser/Thr protein kinase)